LFFISKRDKRVAMRFTAETRGYLKCKISPWLTWRGGRTYRRTPYGRFSQNPNFLDACLSNFLTLGAPLRALRARELSFYWDLLSSLFIFFTTFIFHVFFAALILLKHWYWIVVRLYWHFFSRTSLLIAQRSCVNIIKRYKDYFVNPFLWSRNRLLVPTSCHWPMFLTLQIDFSFCLV